MHARISTFQAPAERLPSIHQAMVNADTSDLREDKGYRGGAMFLNQQTGQAITIAYWETEADMEAALPFHQARTALAERAGVIPGTTETYAVIGTPGQPSADRGATSSSRGQGRDEAASWMGGGPTRGSGPPPGGESHPLTDPGSGTATSDV